MMKTKTVLSILALLIVSCRSAASTPQQTPVAAFQGTVNQDCAPWDGLAFTIAIPYDPTVTIQISIWDWPDGNQTEFSFPDETGRMGYAALNIASSEPLSGTVLMGQVKEGRPIEGQFDLFTKTGLQFNGRFTAHWGDFVALCG